VALEPPVRRTGTDATAADPAASRLPAPTVAAETPNVPATRDEMPLAASADRVPATRWRQPVSVAFLPLALVTFLVIAFAMAMWTFLTATT
jgi:hypothetical protein